jgi:hypothetical protein
MSINIQYQVSRNKNIRKGLKNNRKSDKEFIKTRRKLSKSRKIYQGQEKNVMIKKNSLKPRRYNPKVSGNYQKQIPLPYRT